MFDELEARTADGITLRIDRIRTAHDKRGAVVCLHAMMTDGRYFGARRTDRVASALAAAGLDVYVPDFRGHGRSRPPRAGEHDWSFDDLVELDLPAILTATGEPASSITILGHSLGGLVACAALGTNRIPPPRRLVLAATSVWLGETLPRRALMSAYHRITQLAGKAPVRALRAGTADESRGYVDQLTGWARTGRWTNLRGIDYREALATITTPTDAVCGAADWMCRPRDADAIASRIRTCSPLRVIESANHFTLFARGEQVIADLCAT